MAINPDALFAHDFGQPTQEYGPRDAILYALGLGLGDDLARDLPYMDERALSVLPSFAVTLTTPGMWIKAPEFGVDFAKLVHFEQMAWFPTALPPAAQVVGAAKVISLTDRGEGKGAVLVLERTIHDAATGAHYCRLHQTLLLRGDGGFGGTSTPRAESLIPDRAADRTADYVVNGRAALIYRLSGDWNPLHLNPAAAAAAGFERPILHGLASYGMAGVAVSRAMGRDPAMVTQLGCRFSGVVMPGVTLNFHIWTGADNDAHFTAFVGERKVLDQGQISWRL